MIRLPAALLVAVVSCTFPPHSGADESAVQQELRAMRDALEQQAKRIDELTVHVGRLTQALETQKAAPGSSAAGQSAPVAPLTVGTLENSKPVSKAETPVVEPPRAEASAATVKHVVAKGETLTAIAKQHNVAVSDLLKTNKVENERKLQIGQVLIIPASKPSETTPTQTKENP